jgi:predicted ATPase/class 3 adenylate cyclase
MADLPSGTVTFLFTDIEGSTRIAQTHRDHWESLRARHHAILQQAVKAHNGHVFQIIGDAFCVAFHTAIDALNAAVDAQRLLHQEAWTPVPIKVRMGIHSGTAQAGIVDDQSGGYKGYTALARTQRLMSAGHGGQVLISLATEELVGEDVPKDVALRDMGARRLKDLVRPEHIYQLVISDLPADYLPVKTLDAYRHNLPIQLTSFIGREKEMEQITQFISAHRLVTLTGVGGTGKTRLALQVAAEVLDSFPDGVWFVSLAPISDPELIPRAILSALEIPEHPGIAVWQLLMDYLRERKILLVLDNCEHLIDACAKLVDALATHAPGLSILATSREGLGVQGELIWAVPNLTVPDVKQLPPLEQLSQYESLQLFSERATLVQPHFTVSAENAPAVAQICSRLDGIPLAIELAAARVRALDVDQIARRLDDRFRLLTGGSRTALERHQTLRATIDWSHNLLSLDERLLLRRLSVFVGGWTLEAAERVCVLGEEALDVLELLTHLVDKSLVILEGSRYQMLETTRQYAREKLLEWDEAEKLRDQHLAYFFDLAEKADLELRGPGAVKWLHRLGTEIDNLRAALEWPLETGQTATALQMTLKVDWFWFIRSDHSEGLRWLERVLALPDTPEYPILQAAALMRSAHHIYLQMRPRVARPPVEQALTVARAHGDKHNTAGALGFLGLILGSEHSYEAAQVSLRKSMALFREVQDEWSYAVDLMWLGWAAYRNEDEAAALTWHEEALVEFRRLGDRYFECVTLGGIGAVLIDQGDWARALVALRESLSLSRQLGSKYESGTRLWRLAEVAQGIGQAGRAVRLYWASKSTLDAIGAWQLEDDGELERKLAPCRAALGEAEFEAATEAGRALTMDQAIELAMSHE